MEVKDLYLAWEDPVKHRWMPVGRLSYDVRGKKYRFQYLKSAQESENFIPFSPMSDLEVTYETEDDNLFPLFANRLLSKSRPEYKKYLEWLDVEDSKGNPFLILSITGGIRETDKLEVFQCPMRNGKGEYEVKFLCHGLRHLPKDCIARVNTLKAGERLFIMRDVQNLYDSLALILRTDDPVTIVGYCPRYLVKDFDKILKKCGPNSIKISIEKINREAPLNLRLLCKLVAPWPEKFKPCSDKEYMTIG